MFLRRGHREKNYLDSSDEIHEMQPRISVSFSGLLLLKREKGKVTEMVMALNDNAVLVPTPRPIHCRDCYVQCQYGPPLLCLTPEHSGRRIIIQKRNQRLHFCKNNAAALPRLSLHISLCQNTKACIDIKEWTASVLAL